VPIENWPACPLPIACTVAASIAPHTTTVPAPYVPDVVSAQYVGVPHEPVAVAVVIATLFENLPLIVPSSGQFVAFIVTDVREYVFAFGISVNVVSSANVPNARNSGDPLVYVVFCRTAFPSAVSTVSEALPIVDHAHHVRQIEISVAFLAPIDATGGRIAVVRW
jgi:hypothetical protein